MEIILKQYFNCLKVKFLLLIMVVGVILPNRLMAQCGSCTNPAGAVFINSGSICYDENTTITSLTMIAGTLTICDGVILTISGASTFSGTALIQLGNCSEIIIKGSFSGSVNNGIVYIGDGSCDARITIEGASTLGASLTPDSEVHFCNLLGASTAGSPGAATVGCGLPLPIQLSSFGAVVKKNRFVCVEWTTSSEINNEYFTVEKSSDMVNWSTVEVINGAGNSNTTKEYKIMDYFPIKGLSYYRLKQTDFNGTVKYFKSTPVYFKEEKVEVWLSLNSIRVSKELKNAELFNSFGQEVPMMKISDKTYSVDDLPSGLYLLKTDEKTYHKLIIQQ